MAMALEVEVEVEVEVGIEVENKADCHFLNQIGHLLF